MFQNSEVLIVLKLIIQREKWRLSTYSTADFIIVFGSWVKTIFYSVFCSEQYIPNAGAILL